MIKTGKLILEMYEGGSLVRLTGHELTNVTIDQPSRFYTPGTSTLSPPVDPITITIKIDPSKLTTTYEKTGDFAKARALLNKLRKNAEK